MIDPAKLKELVRLMVDNDLSELDLRDEQQKVTIRRGAALVPAPAVYAAPAAATPPTPAAPPAAGSTGSAGAAEDAGLVAIESPMVGTFYAAPNPDAGPFVKVGSPVSSDTVVCMVEAMKVFNEIKSGKSGKVERVLVKNGEAVEFGQKLFLVRP
ncbi:MAG: acetyl-CoA carboxylase biotin carboxyl carrier protein [Phycisphaeraceae bacterium]|nr:MAG: acetyl-CoA carboxylase biotin carboxyl carrier protein [Phycisphaeraceae bacterium]